jgi:hypothetical protein
VQVSRPARQFGLARELGNDVRACSRWARVANRAADRLDAIAHSDQPGAVGGIRARPVVLDRSLSSICSPDQPGQTRWPL